MHKYRPKSWYLLLSVFAAIATLSAIAGIIVFILLGTGVLLVGSSLHGWHVQNLIPLAIVWGVPILLIVPLALTGIVLPLGNSLLSYLEIGPTGLELRSWPGYRLRCTWGEVIGVEKVQIIAEYSLPMLRIKGRPGPYLSGRRTEPSLRIRAILSLSWPARRNLIPVYLFEGWPDGKLRRDLESRLGPISFDQAVDAE